MFAIAVSLIMSMSCTAELKPPKFDAARAFSYLTAQVNFGPRVPGTEANKNCRTYFYQFFQNLKIPCDSQTFEFDDPYSGKKVPLVNVIPRIKGKDSLSLGILLMAHYDSRPRTDYPSSPEFADEPLVGANDGASGAAVLMELANLLAENQPPRNIDFAFVDGEDWGEIGDNAYYLLGSKEFARRGVRNKYKFAIVVDMVGDSDQQICRETFSQEFHPKLNNMIWETAARLEISTFLDSTTHTILDDHISMATSGVPAVVIIDFDYPYWHTELDTVDKCSPQSLENVGRVLAQICYNPEIWPTK